MDTYHTHILIAYKEFFLVINVPIQGHVQQLEIYEVFNLVIPHGNLSAQYNIDSKHLGIICDKAKSSGDFRTAVQHRLKG